MFATTEVRWFYQGAVPPAVWRWFAAPGREVAETPPRIDYYLRILDGDGLGIKLREGRIEVKQRYAQQGVVRFGQCAGHVEQWRKWSFPVAEANRILAELGDGISSWIGIHKQRKVRIFQVLDDTVVEGSANILLGQGCAWEVAQVGVEKTAVQWWSVGFEAFGEAAGQGEMMKVIAEHILSIDKAPVLELKDSYSYPKWLQGVFKQE